MEYNYELDLQIDETALDVEWIGQPLLTMKYSKAYALARKEADRLKEELSVLRAELDRKIRLDPAGHGLEKATEMAFQNAVLMEPKYKEKTQELIEAQYEVEMTRGALSAIEHRKQALENLSRLLGLQYFSGPRVPRDLPKEVQRRQQASISENKQEQADKVVTIPRRRRRN